MNVTVPRGLTSTHLCFDDSPFGKFSESRLELMRHHGKPFLYRELLEKYIDELKTHAHESKVSHRIRCILNGDIVEPYSIEFDRVRAYSAEPKVNLSFKEGRNIGAEFYKKFLA